MPRFPLLREIKKAIPPTLFFLIIFHLTFLLRHLNDEGLGITTEQSFSALIGALVMGKAYLAMDTLSFVNLFKGRPLILSTLWKGIIFLLFASLGLFLEEYLPLAWHHRSFTASWHLFVHGFSLPLFEANHLFLAFWILLFTGSSELIQAIGRDRVLALFFGTRWARSH